MVDYRIQYSKLSGNIVAPPSKSHSLRAILFASLADGKSTIRNCLQSPDIMAMITACGKLGANIELKSDSIDIIGVAGKPSLPDNVIDAGNSGQVLRFIAAVSALIDGYTVLTGDHSLRYNRPLRPLIEGLSQLGASCMSTKGDDYAPLIVKGPICAGHAILDGADSQPISGLLIAAAFLVGRTTLTVNNAGEKPWVALTLNWFDRLGIHYCHQNFEQYTVEGGQLIKSFDYIVPGDFSSIAYPMVAALLNQSSICIDNIDIDDTQGDKKIIDILLRMGANIVLKDNSLLIQPSQQLSGCEIDVNDFIDALPILAVVGCYASGETRLINAGIARKKESDRLATVTTELRKMGAKIEELPDSLVIKGQALRSATVESHHDHRIAMSLAVAASTVKTHSVIKNIACVSKSYPDFYQDMLSLGSAIERSE